MRRPTLTLVVLLAILSGCKREDMYTQNYVKTWDRSTFFNNGTSMRHPVNGTVARDAPNGPVSPPKTIDSALLQRGQERYEIFCTPCHGRAGNGQGMIVQRGFPQPPSFVEGPLRTAKADLFYKTITNGYGAMYSFDTRVSPADRWAVIAYIRALQLSQNVAPDNLPPEDQSRLQAAR